MRCWEWGVSGRSGREWISAPTGLWRRLLLPPTLTAHAIHALGEAAVLQETFCEARQKEFKQRVRDRD